MPKPPVSRPEIEAIIAAHPNIVRVDSATDPRLEDYLRLTDVALRLRTETERGVFMAESATVIGRAIDAGYIPRSFLSAGRWLPGLRTRIAAFPDVPVFVAADEVLEQTTGFHMHRGALAAMQRRPLSPVVDLVRAARRVAVIEDIVDHTNVGAIFRSAAALGVDAVLVTPSCADPLYRRSVRVSMGTVFQVPWTRIPVWPAGIETLRSLGFTVASLALTDDAMSLDELGAHVLETDERLALVLGSEGPGLRSETIAHSDLTVRIPMAGAVDSLNVAAASAVAFWATRAH